MKKAFVLALTILLLLAASGFVSSTPEDTEKEPGTASTAGPVPEPAPSPVPETLAALVGSYRCIEPGFITVAVEITREGGKIAFEISLGDTEAARGSVTAGENDRAAFRGRDAVGHPVSAVLAPVADTLNYTLTFTSASISELLPAGTRLVLRKNGVPEGLEPFIGSFLASGIDNPAPATLVIGEDGAFSLSIERLTVFRGYVDAILPGAVQLSALDPSGGHIRFEFGLRDGEYRIRVTDSGWMLLPAGETFRFGNGALSAVSEGFEDFIGSYTAPGPSPADLLIGGDGSFDLVIERLAGFHGVVSAAGSGYVSLSAADPNGNPISFALEERGGTFTLRVTDSVWNLLPEGEQFIFSAGTVPAVTTGYEGFIGGYTSYRPGPAVLTIQTDGGFLLEIQRLCVISGNVSSAKEGFIVLSGLDLNGESIVFSFGNKFDEYELHVTDSAWSLLPAGEVFGFRKEPGTTPAPSPAEGPVQTPPEEPAASPAAEKDAGPAVKPAEGEAAEPGGRPEHISGRVFFAFLAAAAAVGVLLLTHGRKKPRH